MDQSEGSGQHHCCGYENTLAHVVYSFSTCFRLSHVKRPVGRVGVDGGWGLVGHEGVLLWKATRRPRDADACVSRDRPRTPYTRSDTGSPDTRLFARVLCSDDHARRVPSCLWRVKRTAQSRHARLSLKPVPRENRPAALLLLSDQARDPQHLRQQHSRGDTHREFLHTSLADRTVAAYTRLLERLSGRGDFYALPYRQRSSPH